MSAVALDTSVAIPLLAQTHRAHAEVVRWWDGRPVVLSGHAVVETFSVLTRLPGDLRMSPHGAAELMDARFGPPLIMGADNAARLPALLGGLGIAGGAVYDALVGLAAAEHDILLATRDARARGTYELVGAAVLVV